MFTKVQNKRDGKLVSIPFVNIIKNILSSNFHSCIVEFLVLDK